MQAEHGLEFPLVEASAEDVPLPDAIFDLAVSEYGASIWATRTSGSPRRRGCSGPAASSSSSSTGRSLMLCSPDDEVEPPGTRAAPPVLRHAPVRVGRRRRRSSSTSATATGSGCSARTASRSSTSIEIQAPPRARRHRYDALHRRSGRERWPAEEIWVRAQARRERPPAPPLLLASTSPQRRAILEQLGIPFEVVAPDYEEHDPPDADPVALVPRARARARPARSTAGDGRPVLGVDTTVVCDGRVFGKPAGPEDAEEMLERARRPHARGRLRASACARRAGRSVEHEVTRVTFRPLTAARPRRLRRDGRVGGTRRRATRSRASAPRSSSASRATT